MKFTWKLALLFLLPFSVVIAHSQQTGITGVVTDSQGATIQNAKVEAKQPGGASFAATTNDHGVYVIPNIAAEEYTVTVSAPNFATAEKKILVLVGQWRRRISLCRLRPAQPKWSLKPVATWQSIQQRLKSPATSLRRKCRIFQ